MATYLVLQNTYTTVECAVFRDSNLIQFLSIDKKIASADLIPCIKNLLESLHLTLTALDFIAVNQGPGPFTTLRVVIATANGLAFSTRLPLIGVDGLDALLQEFENPFYSTDVALLNAFNNDVYFAIKTEHGVRKGVQTIVTLVQEIMQTQGVIQFMGNGAHLYKEQLQIALGDRAAFAHPAPEVASINQIAMLALHKWQKGATPSKQLMPLYLKTL